MYDREPTLRLAPGLSTSRARARVELHHHAGLDVEPVGDPVGLSAGVHPEFLADDQLRQHDEGQRLEEGVVLRSAQRGGIGGDSSASRWSAR